MDTNQSYNAVFSVRFMATTVLACSFIAFSLGRIARLVVLPEFPQEENQFVRIDQESKNNLPTPLAKGGKLVPETIYTARVFDTRRSFSMSSQWLQKEETEDTSSDDDIPVPKNEKLTMLNETDVEEFMDEEEHLPAGQHLLVDIDGLDESFLDSEKRLATAMIQLVDMSGLTLLSYHCHGLTPAGVSCAGVLLESHVAFHTWPKEGVITLDLFTCGSTSLLNHLHLIENLFIVPRNEVETPNVLWAYKRRGFKSQFTNPGSRDTFAYPLGLHGLGMKKQVAHIETDLGKQAWIYDVQREQNRQADGLDLHRYLYLDGVLKSSTVGLARAHGSFVHPSMLAHENPKTVVIFGSGQGATIREVLKHESVEQVVVVGDDHSMFEFARENLPQWNDCSDLVGSTSNCFDDPRVKTVSENPNTWLQKARDGGMAFDIVLVDLFDLEEEYAAEAMNNRASFFADILQSLAKSGVAALHVSGDALPVDSSLTNTHGVRAGNRRDLQTAVVKDLARSGFKETKEYEQKVVGFTESRNYVVAFKDMETVRNWHRNEAQVNFEIRKRAVATRSGDSPFLVFDSAKMISYSRGSSKPDDIKSCGGSSPPEWCDPRAKLDVALQASASLEAVVVSKKSQNDVNKSLNMDQCSGKNVSEEDTEACNWADANVEQATSYTSIES